MSLAFGLCVLLLLFFIGKIKREIIGTNKNRINWIVLIWIDTTNILYRSQYEWWMFSIRSVSRFIHRISHCLSTKWIWYITIKSIFNVSYTIYCTFEGVFFYVSFGWRELHLHDILSLSPSLFSVWMCGFRERPMISLWRVINSFKYIQVCVGQTCGCTNLTEIASQTEAHDFMAFSVYKEHLLLFICSMKHIEHLMTQFGNIKNILIVSATRVSRFTHMSRKK